jgi:tetratricopeptide (TPR) repeat protein/tRNA A-37 threonylcarbamoyl transferase component Bud32
VSEFSDPSRVDGHSEVTVVDDRERPRTSQVEARVLGAGTQVGPYLILEPVGMGGVGVVYAAYDPRLDRRVALKLLRGSRRRTVEARQRLEREARAMAQLSHPNVITVHDVGEFEDEVFLTMEFAEGGTLKAWAKELPRPRSSEQIERCLELYIKAGRGLAAAHEAGLVHRDFKPDNVLLGKSGQVMVTDFGLVRDTEESGAEAAALRASLPDLSSSALDELQLTRTGSVMGTPAYMSPEQHSGLVVDALSDQFSFCVSLYQALYAERPFSGATLAALALAVTEGEIRQPPKGTRVPERLRKVLLRGLAAAPSDRWPSMDELLDELMRVGLSRGFRAPIWLGATLVATLGLGIAMNVGRDAPKCEGAAGAWGQSWSSTKASEVRGAFEKTGLPFATPSFDRADGLLRGYEKQWKLAFVDNCQATRVRGVQSGRLMDLRTLCLERGRDQVRTVVSMLSEVDEKNLAGVDALLSNLSPVSDCSDKEKLLRSDFQFELDSPMARELRDRLSRAKLLQLGGRFEKSRRESEQALEVAESAAEPILIAESQVALAGVLNAMGKHDEARALLDSALGHALQVGDLGVTAHAWTEMISLVGFSKGLPAQGREYARLALAAYAGDGGEDERGIARAHHGLGLIAYGAGEYDEAEKQFRRVLAVNENHWGPDHPRTADVLNNLGAIAFARDDLDGSEAYHLRCLAIWSEAYSGEHPDIATSHNNLGTIYEARGQADAAIESFEKALGIRLRTLGPDHASVAMSHYNLGVALEGKEDLDAARKELETAFHGFVGAYGPEHRRVAAAETALGRVLVRLGDETKALPKLDHALTVRAQSEGDPSELAETKYALAMALIASDRTRAVRLAREAHAAFAESWPEEAAEVLGWVEKQEGEIPPR